MPCRDSITGRKRDAFRVCTLTDGPIVFRLSMFVNSFPKQVHCRQDGLSALISAAYMLAYPAFTVLLFAKPSDLWYKRRLSPQMGCLS